MFIPHFVSQAGADELASAFNWCSSFDDIFPDDITSDSDKAHMWGMFSGIAVGEAVVAATPQNNPWMDTMGQLMNR